MWRKTQFNTLSVATVQREMLTMTRLICFAPWKHNYKKSCILPTSLHAQNHMSESGVCSVHFFFLFLFFFLKKAKNGVHASYTAALLLPSTRSRWRIPQWPWVPFLQGNQRGIRKLQEVHTVLCSLGWLVYPVYVQQLSQIDWLPGQGPLSSKMSSMAMSLLTDEPLIASNTIWNSDTKRETVA